jgi:hypothetical protein
MSSKSLLDVFIYRSYRRYPSIVSVYGDWSDWGLVLPFALLVRKSHSFALNRS